jgi:hypothetical protein
MNHTNTVMLAIFVALGVMLIAGLVAIPIVSQAQAVVLGWGNKIDQRILSAGIGGGGGIPQNP